MVGRATRHRVYLTVEILVPYRALFFQVDVLPVGPLDAAAGLELGDLRAREQVARAKLHPAGHIALQEALAVLVAQVATLTARRLA